MQAIRIRRRTLTIWTNLRNNLAKLRFDCKEGRDARPELEKLSMNYSFIPRAQQQNLLTTHVKHSISFVENEIRDATQVGVPLLEMVDETSWGCNDCRYKNKRGKETRDG